jgi:hypothetical protein
LADALQAHLHEAVVDAVVPTTALRFRAKLGAALNVGKEGFELHVSAREASVGDVSVELDGALRQDRLSFRVSASGDADEWSPLTSRVGIGRPPGDLRLSAAGFGSWEQLTVGGQAQLGEERLQFASELDLGRSSLALSARTTPFSLADVDPSLPALVALLEVEGTVAWSEGVVLTARGAVRGIRYDQLGFPDLSFAAGYDPHHVALRVTAIECQCVDIAVRSRFVGLMSPWQMPNGASWSRRPCIAASVSATGISSSHARTAGTAPWSATILPRSVPVANAVVRHGRLDTGSIATSR